MLNATAIHDFISYWRNQKSMQVASTGNCSIRANVKYSFAGKSVCEETIVTFTRNGIDDGKVSLQEKGALSVQVFHLDFTPNFQKYQYRKEDHSFLVEGNSPKMNGKYEVTILPS